jgi:hypothetical protein
MTSKMHQTGLCKCSETLFNRKSGPHRLPTGKWRLMKEVLGLPLVQATKANCPYTKARVLHQANSLAPAFFTFFCATEQNSISAT